ncbi:hypothetical protein ABFS82_02G052100 [Erythranthe guttata]|uniref:non-specific serine/threonine protein kinase n=1 Tax=Erythranthe guttata TaxID=4155 RepID=A0A022PPX8_ERYGU|nr:PREDICTED: L-type lectin-domain containing receptor kinase IX.1-like [Erythranthe guttata]EYU18392.1 hypothetical protein MIMGU_mgv1a002656mg [Erythranthe guttata]|eukprot:XP_012828475.1 PREDICTED: L-type lectin-domain containing receptor kinase IX.1-like [Erythranthe guttata]
MDLTIFLVIFLIPSSSSLSFNFSSIGHSTSHSITILGSGYISEKGIQVTTDERGERLAQLVGRATYIDPLHLWDRASRKIADFSTSFSFVIDSRGSLDLGDGLTFFLAPIGSTIQPWSFGGNLALGNGGVPVNSTSQAFVAVEFDTYQNLYDPPQQTHVGIDINSMKSVVTTKWENNVTLGLQNDAWVSYNGSSMELRVEFTGKSRNGTQRGNLSYMVDFRDYLPENVTVGFSAATGDLFETHTVKSWEFYSSSLELAPPPPPPLPPRIVSSSLPPQPNAGGGGGGVGLVVGLSVGLAIVIVSLVFASYFLWWRKKKNNKKEMGDDRAGSFHPHMDIEFQKGCGPKKFSYRELVRATNNFAKEEKLGEGGFGGVYRGFLAETNSYIAVKRVSSGSKQGLKEYASEVKIISQLRHRNLVQLHGWCHERGELLLVYEYLPNGSLDSHLFKGQTILPWEVRYRIAQGVASALLYLHEEWERAVVHRDIKASNIMLDSNFNAKLGDFGLARLVDHEKGSQTTVLAGTFGYMAPECVVTGRASKETDIYSLGIVFLEIACGKRPIGRSKDQEKQMVLVEWVWSLYRSGRLIEAADPELAESGYDEREVEQVMAVGMWCARPESDQRPSIRQVINALSSEADVVPGFPPLMSVPT